MSKQQNDTIIYVYTFMCGNNAQCLTFICLL